MFRIYFHVDTCQPRQRGAALILGRNFACGENHAFGLRSCLSENKFLASPFLGGRKPEVFIYIKG